MSIYKDIPENLSSVVLAETKPKMFITEELEIHFGLLGDELKDVLKKLTIKSSVHFSQILPLFLVVEMKKMKKQIDDLTSEIQKLKSQTNINEVERNIE